MGFIPCASEATKYRSNRLLKAAGLGEKTIAIKLTLAATGRNFPYISGRINSDSRS